MNDQQRPEPTGAAPARDTRESQREGQAAEARGAADFGGRRNPRRRHGGREGQPPQQSQSRGRTEQSINMDELRELFSLISAQGFTEFELEKEGFRVRLRRDLAPQGGGQHASSSSQPIHSTAFAPFQSAPPPVAESSPQRATQPDGAASGGGQAEAASASADADLHMITSPIVGTFYRSPSPAAEPFVRAGDQVESETVVCIVEAMKLMNEIQAETTGKVEMIYVENGQAVEYGQPLFGIRK